MTATPAALLELAGRLAEPAPLTEAARRLLDPWLERIRAGGLRLRRQRDERGIHRLSARRAPRPAGWSTAPTGSPGWSGSRPEPLSPGEVREATRLSLSYTPNDLVVLDWAAGFVADTDCADTLQVIEFANVQLLEFRHIDDRLDDRLEAAYRLIRPERRPSLAAAVLAAPRRRRPPDPRDGDRGDQPVRAGRQRPEADRRPLPGPGLRGRLERGSTSAAGSRASAASSRPSATCTTSWSSRPAASAWRPSRSPSSS